MKALLVIALLGFLGFAGRELYQQLLRSSAKSQADAAQHARNAANEAAYDDILKKLHAPEVKDPEAEARQLITSSLIKLRGALAANTTTNDIIGIQLNLKWYSEARSSPNIPTAWISLLPSTTDANYFSSRCARAIDEAAGRPIAQEDLTYIQAESKRLAASIDAALPLLK